jgi:hypothetical protein
MRKHVFNTRHLSSRGDSPVVRRIACALITIAACTLLATPASAKSGPSVPITGTCTFGAIGGTWARADFSPALSATSGGFTNLYAHGSCVTTAGNQAIDIAISASGLWTCNGGAVVGGPGSSLIFSSGTPNAQSSLVPTVVGSPGTVNVELRDSSLRFEAVGDFVWGNPTDVANCELGGISSEPLVGQLTFVSD